MLTITSLENITRTHYSQGHPSPECRSKQNEKFGFSGDLPEEMGDENHEGLMTFIANVKGVVSLGLTGRSSDPHVNTSH